jgi:hypothetical protein
VNSGLSEASCSLQRAQAHTDAKFLQVVDRDLAQIGIGGVTEIIATIETLGEAGVRQQFLGTHKIVLGGRRLPVEIEIFREHAAGQMRVTKRERLIHRFAVDRQIDGLPNALIVPG